MNFVMMVFKGHGKGVMEHEWDWEPKRVLLLLAVFLCIIGNLNPENLHVTYK